MLFFQHRTFCFGPRVMWKSPNLRKFIVCLLLGLFTSWGLQDSTVWAQRPDFRRDGGDRGDRDRGGSDRGGADRGGFDRGRFTGGPPGGGPPSGGRPSFGPPGGGPPGGGPPSGGDPRSRFSPDRIFGFMDRNQDGRIDSEELERVPGPLRDRFKEMGVDTSRGLSKDAFTKTFERMREEREREQERDRGRDDDRRREEGNREDNRSSTAQKPKTRPVVPDKERVTVDLPSQFSEGDTDGDGQVAFYEWRSWKRAETQNFFDYDHNGDGFLTPKELVKGPKAPVEPVATSLASTTSRPASTVSAASTSSPAVTSTPKAASPGSVDMSSPEAIRGRNMFRLLDKDRSGNISTEEWQASSRLKPMFENAGVDLSKPMDQDAFITQYVKIEST